MTDARDPKPWTVLRSRHVLERKFFKVREDHVRLPGGAEICDYCVSENPPWVIVLAVTSDDALVLVRQYRHGIAQVHDELPGGVVDPGETPEVAARRELLEETGFGGGRWRPFMVQAPNPASQDNLAHVFLAEGVTRQAPRDPEPTEELVVRTVPMREVLGLIDAGAFAQAMCIAPVCRYLLSRRDLG